MVILAMVVFILTSWNRKYDRPFPTLKASKDSTMIAHGKYLVYGPAHCASCHIPLDKLKDLEAGQEVPLTGGHEFKLPLGTLVTKNLTSDKETGLGDYTDGELSRVLRYNVRKDGQPMLGLMPFANMSDYDVTCILSYLRTVPPVKVNNKETSWNFLGKALHAFGQLPPESPEATPPANVPADTTAAYGKYLAYSVSNCRGCHTNRDLKTGDYIGPFFAGGFHLEDDMNPGTFYVSRNLTPDPQTGHIAHWSEAQFINRFHQGRVFPNSPMPWTQFKKMSDDDLRAIWNFLQSLKPVMQDNGEAVQKS